MDKQLTVKKHERTTKVFVQLGLDGSSIISSAYPSFWFGRQILLGISSKL